MHRKPHSRLMRAARLLPIATLCPTLFAGFWLASQDVSAAEPGTTRAVLKPQEISFFYQSFTAFYSCEGIESKVRRLLLALGASKDLDVEARGCEAGGGVVRSPYLTIRLTSPVEATPEALAELEKTRTQRELTAKVRGNRGVATDAAAQFDARWKPVSLSRGQLGLEPGDCELVDELRKKVLPKLGVRIINDNVQCTPNQINRAQPRLEVEALVQPPAPEAGTAGGSAPTATDSSAIKPAEGVAPDPPSSAKPQS